MRVTHLILLFALSVSCASTTGSSPLGVLIELPETDACPTALHRAIEEARDASSDEDVIALSQAMRWAIDHDEVRCTPTTTAMALWQACMDALQRIETPSARVAIVISLESTHLPGSLHDRHNAQFRDQTEIALSAIEASESNEQEVIDALLRWYAAGAADCSNELYRSRIVSLIIAAGEETVASLVEQFPPLPGGDRCAPVWLVLDLYRELPEEARARLVEQILQRPTTTLVRAVELLRAIGGPAEALCSDVATGACSTAVEGVNAALAGNEDPTHAYEEAALLCEVAFNPQPVVALRLRLMNWLVDNERVDEAWAFIEEMPVDTVPRAQRASIGNAVVLERLGRNDLSEAIAVLEMLADQINLESEASIQPARQATQHAILAAVEGAIVEQNYEVAQRMLETMVRLTGAAEQARRFEISITLSQFLTTAEGDDCPNRRELATRGRDLRNLRTEVADQFREDEELVALYQRTERQWRTYQERCQR